KAVAMGRMDVSGGATLLFITNAVTITFAASLVFFSLGFRGPLTNSQQRVPRSLFVSAIFTLILLGSLSYLSYRLFETANDNRMIEKVLYEEVDKIEDAELIDWKATSSGETLELDIVLRTLRLIRYEDSVALQKAIADRLQRPVSLVINQVHAALLDPLVPPTATPTPLPTLTSTPGPSPTLTYTPTKKPTSTPAPTETVTPTLAPTFTATPTSTPTPALAKAVNTVVQGLRLRQWPAGPEIAVLRRDDSLKVLYGKRVLVWLEVEDKEGRVGWIPEIYLFIVTLTPTNTPTPTITGTPAANMMGNLSPTP
ncbi:SH3 domain-containing protein, partial [Chloroflexota bacterium]